MKYELKNELKIIFAGVVFVVFVVGIVMFGVRQFSLAITTVDVIEVEPGVRCARMVTADGAAISCWRTE